MVLRKGDMSSLDYLQKMTVKFARLGTVIFLSELLLKVIV